MALGIGITGHRTGGGSSVDESALTPMPMPVTFKTLTLKDGTTTNVATNNNIKIRDAAGVSWTVEQWHAAAIARGFDPTGVAKPVGFDITAFGKHFVYYFDNKYNEPAGDSKNYYDVTGQTLITNGGLRHSQWQHTMDTFANPGSTPITRTYNGVVATATADGNDVILSTSNSFQTWRIKKDITTSGALVTDKAKDYFNALLAYTDFYRTLAALNTGIDATDEPDGTKGEVYIETSDHGIPGAGEDRYFGIFSDMHQEESIHTNIKAKYNVHSILGADNLTQEMADAIYDKQVANNVNICSTEISSYHKTALTEGAKGCEAYVFGGKWYIVTPVLSRCNLAQVATGSADYFIPDAPAISWVKWFGTQSDVDAYMPDERMLQAVWVNRNSCLNSIITYLNLASTKGEAWGVRSFAAEYSWSVVRGSAGSSWYVYLFYGNINGINVCIRYVSSAVSALE